MNLGSGGGGGSGSSGGVSLSVETFRSEDGSSILWGKLATTIIGALMAAYGVGVSAIVDAVFQLAIGGVDWVANFASGLVTEGVGVFITLGTTAWNLALAPVKGMAGLWVPFAVLAVALGYLYLIQGGAD
jgi:hypothetical protein